MENAERSDPASSPWRSIWWQPQATIRGLIRRDSNASTLLLAAVAGIATTIGLAGMASNLHWFAVLAGGVLIGPFAGLLGLFVEGAVLSWTGYMLGGRAGQPALRTAIAWGGLPNVALVPILIGALAVFRQDFLRADTTTGELDSILLIVLLIVAALPLWSIVLRIRTVGAVQQFGLVRSVLNVAAAAIVLLAAAGAFRTFVAQPFLIASGSMEPTLHAGDYVFVDKRSYGFSRYSFPIDARFNGRFGFSQPARGDIVAFKGPSDPGIDYIKRIVGLPDDEILMQHGVLHVNGVPVPKRSAGDVSVIDWQGSEQMVPAFEEILPDGRTHTVLDSEPEGQLDNVGPFKVAAGHYFVMGDNRDNSMDSRSVQQFGFVPADFLIGRVSLIYFSAGEPRDTDTISGAFANVRWDRILQSPK
jgi:signal peptidase I